MAYARPRLLLAVALITACSEGDNDDAGTLSATSTATAPATDTTQSPTTEVPTTGEPMGTSTTGEPATSDEPGTSTTALPTTGEPDPSTSDTGSGDETGPICDPGMPNCVCDNGTCIEGYVCQDDVCGVGLECPDDVEPPADNEDTPIDLGDITDNDDDFFDQSGVLSGTSDADWYSFHGKDTLGYVAEATFTLVGGTQRNCLFLECDEGGVAQTGVECPGGSDFAISPKLRPGCCSAASFQIKDLNCPGNDESVKAWVRIDKAAADSCSPYEFKIHF